MSNTNTPLAKPLRSQLENTVKAARDVAEKAARGALAQLAVGEAKAPDYLTDDLKALRRRLRAHGRALGDTKDKDDTQGLQHLVWEVAYEHWHRMLFARFLAENGLLMWEPGAPVSLDDCEAWCRTADPEHEPGRQEPSGNWLASWPPACCRRCSSRRARCSSWPSRPSTSASWSACWPRCRPRCSRPATAWAGSTSSGRPSARTRSTPRR